MLRWIFCGMLAALSSSCTTLRPGVVHQLDFGAGYQSITQPATGEIAKSGPSYLGRYQISYQSSRLGELGVGLGFQETHQSGSSATLSQVLVNRSTSTDLSYLLPFRGGTVWVGGMYRNLFGEGARIESSNTDGFQVLSMAGPQIRFNFTASSWNWVAGLAGLRSVNLGERQISEITGFAGVRFPKM